MNHRPAGPEEFPLGRLAVLAALLGAPIAAVLLAHPHANPDSHAFEALARSVLAGRGLVYREPMLAGLDLYAFRSPGYSLFVALGLALGGIPVVLALQGALTGVAAALVGAIAHRLAGARAAWLAFALALAWPMSWILAGQLMSETLYGFLVVATGALALSAAARVSLARAALAGLACALALLVRPTGLALLVAVVAWLAWRFPAGARVAALVALLAWAPWPLRNARHLDGFTPLLTSGGINAWSGHTRRPVSEGWEWMQDHVELGERGLDRALSRMALAAARDRPLRTARAAARRAVFHAAPIERDRRQAVHVVAWVLALGALASPVWRSRLALPGFIWLAHGALGALTVTGDRYRWPTEWVVALAAAFGVCALLAALRRRGTS